jgi:hypothetical protein
MTPRTVAEIAAEIEERGKSATKGPLHGEEYATGIHIRPETGHAIAYFSIGPDDWHRLRGEPQEAKNAKFFIAARDADLVAKTLREIAEAVLKLDCLSVITDGVACPIRCDGLVEYCDSCAARNIARDAGFGGKT